MIAVRHVSSTRRRSIRALAALALVGAFVAAPLAIGAAAARADSPGPTTASENPIQVTINTIKPLAPQPGDTLVVAGTLRNVTDAPLTDLYYALKLSMSTVTFQSSFDSFADDQEGDLSSDVTSDTLPVSVQQVSDPNTLTQAAPATLNGGESEHFGISVPITSQFMSDFDLGTTWGVHEMGVTVSSGDTSVGRVRTFLPWAPRATPEPPLGVAWLLPLADRPHRGASGTWFDDDLAAELDPKTGRLGGLVAAGTAAEDQTGHGRHPTTAAVPVTWALDPMLVSDVSAMTASNGYKVTTATGTSAGTGGTAAKAFFSALQSVVTKPDASVIALPYGDPDIVAAIRAGLTRTIATASTDGRLVLQHLLGVNPTQHYGWPIGGLADSHTVNTMYTVLQDNPLILNDADVPAETQLTYTPNAATSLTANGADVPTLLTNSNLTDDVVNGSGDTSNPDGSRISIQRYLAETLLIHTQQPSPGRNVIVAPGRRWDPAATYATKVLTDTGKVPWIAPTSVNDVAASKPDTSVIRRVNYPTSARNNELPQSYLSQVNTAHKDINRFGTILPQDNSEVRDLNVAVQQALSAGWRGDREVATKVVKGLAYTAKQAQRQVRVATNPNSRVTLTSHGGNVPVTVENDLAIPVHVMVKLSSHGHRLVVPNSGLISEILPPNQLTRVDFHATAKTSGVFEAKVQLYTPNGTKYGLPTKIYVKSTVYGKITLVITGAATGALLLAVFVRLTRRARAARRSAATPAT